MAFRSKQSDTQTLSVLHATFALTGVLHAIGGALLPSLAASFQLSDSQSGSLFLCYFAGSSLAPLFCVGRYGRLMAIGFLCVTATCVGIATADPMFLRPLFLLLGVAVGVPMSSVSIFAGRKFTDRSAAPLTFLNFSWSLGALIAPLLAARLLVHHNFRATYLVLALAALVASAACWFMLGDPPPALTRGNLRSMANLRWIGLVAVLTFLEVGIENTTATWLATFVIRASGSGPAVAAASSSLYWCGFLASRAIFSFVLLHVKPMRVLSASVLVGVLASILLIRLSGTPLRSISMLVLGAALAPIFPLLLSRFFAHARDAADGRFVLACCGFGGSVLPWLTGTISAHSGSLRVGLIVVPASLIVIAALLPLLASRQPCLEHPEPQQP